MSESRDAQRRRILAALHALSESDDESALGISDALRRDLARLDGPREEGGVSDLVEFLEARIAEDEERALAAQDHPADGPVEVWTPTKGSVYSGSAVVRAGSAQVLPVAERVNGSRARHIARWDPARVLAECEAKRAIVALRAWLHETARTSEPEEARSARDSRAAVDAVLRILALPYADHSEYRDEWRP